MSWLQRGCGVCTHLPPAYRPDLRVAPWASELLVGSVLSRRIPVWTISVSQDSKRSLWSVSTQRRHSLFQVSVRVALLICFLSVSSSIGVKVRRVPVAPSLVGGRHSLVPTETTKQWTNRESQTFSIPRRETAKPTNRGFFVWLTSYWFSTYWLDNQARSLNLKRGIRASYFQTYPYTSPTLGRASVICLVMQNNKTKTV